MMFNTPAFWYKKQGALSKALSPIAKLYSSISQNHTNQQTPYKANMPVICVGNLTVGGSGKTPVVISLLNIVLSENICSNPCILSRGYGGTKDVHLVESTDTFEDVGDEPKLMSRYAPVIVSKDRSSGAKLAEKHNYDLIIMDDGFQNQTLYKDFNFLVIDGTSGFGNKNLIPAGPLREPIDQGLKRTDIVIILNQDTYGVKNVIQPTPYLKADVRAIIKNDDFRHHKYIAFCGIAHPDKFKRTLKDVDIKLIDFKTYPDHYVFKQSDIDQLYKQAKNDNVRLITTEKDYVRLMSFSKLVEITDVLPIELIWDDHQRIIDVLRSIITRAK